MQRKKRSKEIKRRQREMHLLSSCRNRRSSLSRRHKLKLKHKKSKNNLQLHLKRKSLNNNSSRNLRLKRKQNQWLNFQTFLRWIFEWEESLRCGSILKAKSCTAKKSILGTVK